MKLFCDKKILNRESKLIYFFIAVGIVLRLYYFFLNRSLWIDEVYLSSGIVMKEISDLLSGNLMYYQKAPLLFLLIQKFCTILFGNNEFSLRVFPLICSVASLFFMAPVAKYFLPKNFSWLAIAIIALSGPLIHHSAEAKQYAADIMATSLVLLLYVKAKINDTTKAIVLLAAIGALTIWVSFPIIFIMTGIGTALAVPAVRQKSKKLLFKYGAVSLIWLISFATSYFLITKKFAESEWTVYWFNYYKYFISIPQTFQELTWLPQRLYRMLGYPMGLWWKLPSVETTIFSTVLKLGAAFSFIVLLCGIFNVIRMKKHVLVLLSPFFFVLVANSLRLYPLGDRFWVFLAPIITILIAMGVSLLCRNVKSKLVTNALPAILLMGPIVTSAQLFIDEKEFLPEKRSSQRQTLDYIQANFKPGDVLYVYYTAKPGYILYKTFYQYNFPVILDPDHRLETNNYKEYFSKIKQDLGDLHSVKRIWLLFNYDFQTDIGEAIDTPEWYFNKTKPTDNVVVWFKSFATPVLEKKDSDTHTYCFQINKSP